MGEAPDKMAGLRCDSRLVYDFADTKNAKEFGGSAGLSGETTRAWP
jgi:hypothetical protein